MSAKYRCISLAAIDRAAERFCDPTTLYLVLTKRADPFTGELLTSAVELLQSFSPEAVGSDKTIKRHLAKLVEAELISMGETKGRRQNIIVHEFRPKGSQVVWLSPLNDSADKPNKPESEKDDPTDKSDETEDKKSDSSDKSVDKFGEENLENRTNLSSNSSQASAVEEVTGSPQGTQGTQGIHRAQGTQDTQGTRHKYSQDTSTQDIGHKEPERPAQPSPFDFGIGESSPQKPPSPQSPQKSSAVQAASTAQAGQVCPADTTRVDEIGQARPSSHTASAPPVWHPAAISKSSPEYQKALREFREMETAELWDLYECFEDTPKLPFHARDLYRMKRAIIEGLLGERGEEQ
jgi:hypothetical protein